MPKLTELAREQTSLDREQVGHLNRLVSEWGMLADLSFADLLLSVPSESGAWTVVAQVRPATAQTVYPTDLVGTRVEPAKATLLDDAFRTAAIVDAEPELPLGADGTRWTAIPVVSKGTPIAVLTREWDEQRARRAGQLEDVYLRVFAQFARMIASGTFPFAEGAEDSSSAPRVGDGVMLLGPAAEVRYMSPNASSALHRVGIQASAVGMRLAELGFHDGPVREAYEHRTPVIEEFEQGDEVTLLCRCVPLFEGEVIDGAVLLVRDVTELRKRDRLLLSKDATIREIHHRVKNNLQTISSLLRLQARRLKHPEAIAAVGESVRRIRTIALVHEALSREPGDDVTFMEIVRPLLRLAEEGLQSPDRPVRFTVQGDGGQIPAAIATPLSVVLTELLQNAVEHGFPEGSGGGSVRVTLRNAGDRLDLAVIDDGRGLEGGFRIEDATGLGLSIVRTLVTTELNGTIVMRPNSPRGTLVELSVPLAS